jgi:PAS domain-containing protein
MSYEDVKASPDPLWYRELFEGLPTAALATTTSGVVTHANTAACLLLRRAPNAVMGQPLASFVHPRHRVAFEGALSRALRAAHVEEFALWVCPLNAVPRECRVWVRLVVTLGGDGPVLLWSVASLLPAF